MSEPDVECRAPGGHYFVVRGPDKERPITALLNARRQLRGKRSAEDRAAARAAIGAAKATPGARGPVWWDDGEPHFNRRLVRNTPYAAGYAVLEAFA